MLKQAAARSAGDHDSNGMDAFGRGVSEGAVRGEENGEEKEGEEGEEGEEDTWSVSGYWPVKWPCNLAISSMKSIGKSLYTAGEGEQGISGWERV